jgi:hypothetical protein
MTSFGPGLLVLYCQFASLYVRVKKMPFGQWMLALYFASLYVRVQKKSCTHASLYSMLESKSVLRGGDVSLVICNLVWYLGPGYLAGIFCVLVR